MVAAGSLRLLTLACTGHGVRVPMWGQIGPAAKLYIPQPHHLKAQPFYNKVIESISFKVCFCDSKTPFEFYKSKSKWQSYKYKYKLMFCAFNQFPEYTPRAAPK